MLLEDQEKMNEDLQNEIEERKKAQEELQLSAAHHHSSGTVKRGLEYPRCS